MTVGWTAGPLMSDAFTCASPKCWLCLHKVLLLSVCIAAGPHATMEELFSLRFAHLSHPLHLQYARTCSSPTLIVLAWLSTRRATVHDEQCYRMCIGRYIAIDSENCTPSACVGVRADGKRGARSISLVSVLQALPTQPKLRLRGRARTNTS